MENRPDIQPDFTLIDKLMEWAAWLFMIALWLTVILRYDALPLIIPTHFNAAGEVDDTGDKMVVFFLPIIATLMFIVITVLSQYPRIFNFPVSITPENALRQYTNAVRMLRYLKMVIALIFFWITTVVMLKAAGNTSGFIGPWSLPLLIALIILPMTYFLFKAIRQR